MKSINHSLGKSAVAFLLTGGLIAPAMITTMSTPVMARTQSVFTDEQKVFSGRIIWVGDSRFVGQSQYAKDNNDTYIAKVAMGYNWFNSTAIPQVNAVKQAGEAIVVNIGVNDMNSSALCARLNQLAESDWKDCNVIFMSVNPVNDSKAAAHGYSVRNSQVVAFNNYMKQHLSSKVQYLNTFSVINDNSYNYTSDGVHYTADGYKAIYNKAKSSLPTSQTTISQVQFSNTYDDGKTVKYTVNKSTVKTTVSGKTESRSQTLSDSQWKELVAAIQTLQKDLDNSAALDTVNKYTNFRSYKSTTSAKSDSVSLADNISNVVDSAINKALGNTGKYSDIQKFIVSAGGKQYTIENNALPMVDGKQIGTKKITSADFEKVGDLVDKIEKDPTNTDNVKSLLSVIGVSDTSNNWKNIYATGMPSAVKTATKKSSNKSSSSTKSSTISSSTSSGWTIKNSDGTYTSYSTSSGTNQSSGVGGVSASTDDDSSTSASDNVASTNASKSEDTASTSSASDSAKADNSTSDSNTASASSDSAKTNSAKTDSTKTDDSTKSDNSSTDSSSKDAKSVDEISDSSKTDSKDSGSSDTSKDDAKADDASNGSSKDGDTSSDNSSDDSSKSSGAAASTGSGLGSGSGANGSSSNGTGSNAANSASKSAANRNTGVLSGTGMVIGGGSIGTVLTALGIHQINKKKWYM